MRTKVLRNRHQYDDIIGRMRPVSITRPHMPIIDRAAQFAPFAALNGHGEAMKQTEQRSQKLRS